MSDSIPSASMAKQIMADYKNSTKDNDVKVSESGVNSRFSRAIINKTPQNPNAENDVFMADRGTLFKDADNTTGNKNGKTSVEELTKFINTFDEDKDNQLNDQELKNFNVKYKEDEKKIPSDYFEPPLLIKAIDGAIDYVKKVLD
jgi:hypothetical protein